MVLVYLVVGAGIGFDGSDRIQIDVLTDEGIGFDSGEVLVDAGDINLEESGHTE